MFLADILKKFNLKQLSFSFSITLPSFYKKEAANVIEIYDHNGVIGQAKGVSVIWKRECSPIYQIPGEYNRDEKFRTCALIVDYSVGKRIQSLPEFNIRVNGKSVANGNINVELLGVKIVNEGGSVDMERSFICSFRWITSMDDMKVPFKFVLLMESKEKPNEEK